MKNIRIFYLKIFTFLVVKFSVYLNRHVFVMTGAYYTCEFIMTFIFQFNLILKVIIKITGDDTLLFSWKIKLDISSESSIHTKCRPILSGK